MVGTRKRYGFADSAQQVVGGFLLSGPFVVTEEVWVLAGNMTTAHTAFTVALVFAIGYGALYKADAKRNPEREVEVAGVPVRFVSLMLVSFGSVTVLALAINAPATFGADLWTSIRMVSIVGIFSVVGAATADSVF